MRYFIFLPYFVLLAFLPSTENGKYGDYLGVACLQHLLCPELLNDSVDRQATDRARISTAFQHPTALQTASDVTRFSMHKSGIAWGTKADEAGVVLLLALFNLGLPQPENSVF